MDLKFMQGVQDFFADSMGIALQTFENNEGLTQISNPTDFCVKHILQSPKGRELCNACLLEKLNEVSKNGESIVFKCPSGMTNFAIPIIIDGKNLACVFGGKILTEGIAESVLKKMAQKLSLNEFEFLEASKKIRVIPNDKFLAMAEALTIIVNSIISMAYANFQLSEVGLGYKFPRDISIQEWIISNCPSVQKPLTSREFEVLKLIVQGKSNTEIAKELFISVHTAKAHVSSILEKFLVEDRVQMAVKAVREGII